MNKTAALDRFLRLAEVKVATGLSHATIYRRMAAGTFPRPLRIGPQTVRWRERDVIAWQDSLTA